MALHKPKRTHFLSRHFRSRQANAVLLPHLVLASIIDFWFPAYICHDGGNTSYYLSHLTCREYRSSDALIELSNQCSTFEKMFYPGCHVYIHDDICHTRSEGKVVQVHMILSHLVPFQESKTQVTRYEIMTLDGNTIQALPKQLRFANGSYVCIKVGKESLTGIITGSFENPQLYSKKLSFNEEENKQDLFFYSAQCQSSEKKSFFQHGIKPKDVSILFSPNDTIDIALSKHENKIVSHPIKIDSEEDMSEISLSRVPNGFQKVVRNFSQNYNQPPNHDHNGTVDRPNDDFENRGTKRRMTFPIEEKEACREMKIRQVDSLESKSRCEDRHNNGKRWDRTLNVANARRVDETNFEQIPSSEPCRHERNGCDLNKRNSIGSEKRGRDADSSQNDSYIDSNDWHRYHIKDKHRISTHGIENKGIEIGSFTKDRRDYFCGDDNEYHDSGEPLFEVRARYKFKMLPVHIWSRMTVQERRAHTSGRTPVDILRLCPAKKIRRRNAFRSSSNPKKSWHSP